MSNYQRFNNFVSEYENKIDEESNSTNDEKLQKSLAENANEYVRRSELGSGLLSGAEATYHGREYIQKAKGSYDTLKKLPKTLEQKMIGFKGEAKKFRDDVEEGISDAKQVASQAKEAVNALPKSISEAKESLESAVQSAKETVQGKIQDVKNALNTGVQDAQDTVQQGIASTSRRVAPDVLGRDPENLVSGAMRDTEEEEEEDEIQPRRRVQQEIKPQEQEMQEIKSNYHFPPKDPKDIRKVPPNEETANINEQISTAAKETEKGAKEAGNVAGEIGKGAKLASTEEKIGEGAGELEEESGGVLSDVILPIAAASMVSFAIADLFKNKPKETKIAPKNLLVVPPKFTQEKESLSTTSSLPQ